MTSEATPYDIFVSYRQQEPDKSWVRKVLVPGLKGLGFRLCVDYECFRLGSPIVKEMERGVLESRYTLAVLSPEYLESSFAEIEKIMAEHLGLERRERRLIAIMRRPCDTDLRTRVRLWLDMSDDTETEDKLEYLAGQLRMP